MMALQPAGGQRASCTALMIVGNVERTIRRCMDSLLSSGCFDEFVIVLDSRITDQTANILEGYRARHPEIRLVWYRWDRPKDYAKPRNFGLLHATKDFGFWIDGDEIFTGASGIYSLLQQPGRAAYYSWTVSQTPDGRLIWTTQMRLFPRLTGVKWELPIHEQLAFSVRRLGIPEGVTEVRAIFHLGYMDEATNTEKHRERAGIMRDWLRKHPQKDAKRAYIMEQYNASMHYLRNVPNAGRRQAS